MQSVQCSCAPETPLASPSRSWIMTDTAKANRMRKGRKIDSCPPRCVYFCIRQAFDLQLPIRRISSTITFTFGSVVFQVPQHAFFSERVHAECLYEKSYKGAPDCFFGHAAWVYVSVRNRRYLLSCAIKCCGPVNTAAAMYQGNIRSPLFQHSVLWRRCWRTFWMF